MRISRFASYCVLLWACSWLAPRWPSAVEIRGKIDHGLSRPRLRLLHWVGRAPDKRMDSKSKRKTS